MAKHQEMDETFDQIVKDMIYIYSLDSERDASKFNDEFT